MVCVAVILLLASAARPSWPPTVLGAEASYADDSTTRSWPRCNFQSIAHDPIDQFVFQLLGGRADNLHRDFMSGGCTVWSNRKQSKNCPCSAPLGLLNSGTFVEIGANDGLHMSNTWFFERHLGWRGLCVEGNPHVFRRLQANRPACINVNALVASNGTSVPYISFYREDGTEKKNTANDWETGLSGIEGSTGNKELASLESAKKFALSTMGLRVDRTMLHVQSFADIFARNNFTSIDFMSVDVEGQEATVLRSIDFTKVHIGIIVTETTNPEVTHLLASNGFRDLGIEFVLKDHVFVNTKKNPLQVGGRYRSRSE